MTDDKNTIVSYGDYEGINNGIEMDMIKPEKMVIFNIESML
jgi:hypothetical protein